MRRATPSPAIHSLTVAASDATTATMSSRPPYRGRGRRSSSRHYSGGRDQFVSGDAHFWTVRNANLGFQGEEGGSFVNQPRYQNPPYNRRPPAFYHQNPQFRPPPPHNQTQQFRHSPPLDQSQAFGLQFRHPPPCNQTQQFRQPPPFDQRQAFRPLQHIRPRPPDYRVWEYATTRPPPPYCERFKVLSYNLLADYLAFDHRGKLYCHIPSHFLDWQSRKRSITIELGWWSADIMCLQEVDRFHELEEDFKLKGYSGIWKMRTGDPIDGCAIFWRTSRFKLLCEECIEFNKLRLRDNVAQICVLELINENGALPQRGSSRVVVCNIHVLYNPKRGEIKLGQVRVLLDRAKAVSKTWDDAPVVICGDFNCTPKSPLYNFISEQKLDLSKIDRDKVSGQASAVIHASRLYIPNPSEGSANGLVQATSIEDDKEVTIKPSNSLSDMQSPDIHDNSVENLHTQTVLNMPGESCKQMECGKKSSTLSDPKMDTQQVAADDSKIFGELNLEEDSIASNSQSGAPVNYINDQVHAITFMSSVSEVVRTDTTGMGCTEQISDAVSPSSKELSAEKSNLYAPRENESLKLDGSIISPKSLDTFVAEISSTKPASQATDCDATEVTREADRESPSLELIEKDLMNHSSSLYQVDESHLSSNIDFPLHDKLEKLSVDEIDEPVISGESIVEDDEAFISALHDAEECFPQELGPSNKTDLEKADLFKGAESASEEKTSYNPSLWTPVEMETATGNAENTFMEHPLPLKSTYTEVMDSSGNRDSNGEPLVTSYNRCFMGTVDYIWRSEGIQTVRVLAPIPKHGMEWTAGFPTKKWGSDHIALVSELAFSRDATTHSRNIQ